MTALALVIISLLLQAAPALPADSYLSVELKKEVTSRRSKPGQDVKLVLREPVKASDGSVLIPAGAKLEGKIALARKRSGGESSALAFTVDRAEWKDGEMPLNTVLERLEGLAATESQGCAPNLNRAGMSSCGSAMMNLYPPPADCSVTRIGDNMAIACSKREVELGPGSVLLFRTAAPKP